MNEGIFIVCVVGIITWGIYRLFELYARKKERLLMIEKLSDRMNFPELEKPLHLPVFKKTDISSWFSSISILRISLLMIGLGIGAITAFVIQYAVIGDLLTQSFDNWAKNNINGFKETIYFACITVFGGIGLLIAYLIEQKQNKKQ